MSLVTKKPLIKQQTLHTEEYNSKEKMSLSTKRVSFDSTTISLQSDSDEENSLGKSNRRPVKKPNSEDDDLLNMFRSERSESDDDIAQTEFETKRDGTDKPSPVPRNIRSKSSATDKEDTSKAVSGNQQLDMLEQTVRPKVKKPPQLRKMSEYEYFQEESHRASKPEVAPRKRLTDSDTASDVLKTKNVLKYDTTEQDMGLSNFGGKESMQSRHEFSSSDDDDDIHGGLYKIPKNRNILKRDSNKLNRGHSQPDEESYVQERLTIEKPKLSRENDKVNSNKTIRQKDGEDNDGVNLKKKYKGMVPSPKPRKHPEDGSQEDVSKLEQDYSDNVMGNTNMAPLPKGRKQQEHEKEIVSMSLLSKSRLHPLDKVDDDKEDSGKTLMKISDKRVKIQPKDKNGSREDEVDGPTKKGKALDWSSLDESSDGDDDETVGKKVNLFTKQKPSRENITDNSSVLEMDKISKPKPSPRTRRHKEPQIMKDQGQEVSKKTMNYNDFSPSGYYDSYQRIPREQGVKLEKGQPSIPPRRITTSLRPGSSKGRNNMVWAGKDKEITEYTFEQHIPETDDVISVDDKQGWHRKDQKPQSPITPKRGPMKAGQGIEEMTRSPQLRQTLMNDNEDDWDYSLHHSFGKQKSSSLTNLNRTTESDYRNYYNEDDGPRRNSLDTETIRKTVYDNWLSRKNVTIKKELSQKAIQKQKEQQKRKEEEERKLNAQLAYKTWNKHKTETLKEQHAKLKAKQKEQQEKNELERQMKEKDSKKYFESWKSKKDTIIKETQKGKKKEITEKKKKEAEEKVEKAMSSKKSFENWKSRKDVVLKQQIKEKKKKEKLEESKRDDESYEKIIKNADEFQKWVEKKGKPRRGPPLPALTQRAWVPGGRYTSDCIPATVQPVVLCPSSNRARTMSGTYRGKTKYYDF